MCVGGLVLGEMRQKDFDYYSCCFYASTYSPICCEYFSQKKMCHWSGNTHFFHLLRIFSTKNNVWVSLHVTAAAWVDTKTASVFLGFVSSLTLVLHVLKDKCATSGLSLGMTVNVAQAFSALTCKNFISPHTLAKAKTTLHFIHLRTHSPQIYPNTAQASLPILLIKYSSFRASITAMNGNALQYFLFLQYVLQYWNIHEKMT